MVSRARISRWVAGLAVLALAAVAAPSASALTAAAAADPTVVLSTNFDDGTWAPWTRSGGPTLSVTDVDGSPALLVDQRANDYDGVQSPTGLLTPGQTYTFSMRARLATGTAGSAGVRFVVKPSYSWVGNTTMTADAWTAVSGTFAVPADADPSALQVYLGTDSLAAPYGYLVDDLVITGPPTGGGGETVLSSDFESGLDGWTARADAEGPPTVAVSTLQAHGGAQSALVSGRTSQGDGLAHDVTGLLQSGTTYQVTAWVRFAPGSIPGNVWLSIQRVTAGASSFDTVAQVAAVTGDAWTQVTATYAMPVADTATLYFETDYPSGSAADLYVDDVVVTTQGAPVVQDLTPIKDTVDFPMGVAIDSRELVAPTSTLLTKHVDQVTSENYMKPEAWYDADRMFRTNPEATALMDFARDHGLRVYGHTLVWHSQTPDWFFQHADGTPLTAGAADQQLLKDRMRTHIDSVAQALSTGGGYGLFGSAGNPLVAFDVVNEVVSDGSTDADGLRRSPWYEVLGEQYIDLAFQYADEAFNHTYAAVGASRPIRLMINDYNTEQTGKQQRLHALVARLLARGIPVDGVGHQFHVNLQTPISSLAAAIDAFTDLPVTQDVSELDVPTGTPVTQSGLIDQGYYYRDLFRMLRERSSHLFSVTVWGLTDGRSWRASSGAPLLFTDTLQAKPAYYGVVDGTLPVRQRAAVVFQGTVPLAPAAADDPSWLLLPAASIGEQASFGVRWEPDHLTVRVAVTDATVQPGDAVVLTLGTSTVTVGRDGTSPVPAVVRSTATGWDAVVQLPLTAAAQGEVLAFDVAVTDQTATGTTTAGWNEPGVLGTLSLVEPLSSLAVVQAPVAPTIDGLVEAVWATANAVSTDTVVEGSGGAVATVRTMWSGDTLYVLAQVSDPTLDVSGSDPWIQDSVEIFVNPGNTKAGTYGADDAQLRINVDNLVSFGTGDEAAQAARVTSATTRVAGGYVVEAAIGLAGEGGLGTVQGLDFQVNDATAGARTAVQTWADPTGAGYQSTARWGVGRLAAAPVALHPKVEAPVLALAGLPVKVDLSGFRVGSVVTLGLERVGGKADGQRFELGTVAVGADGTARTSPRVPVAVPSGVYRFVASAAELRATDTLVVLNLTRLLRW